MPIESEEKKYSWVRRGAPESSLDLSSEQARAYGASSARFLRGTMLGRHDISGMTVEDVYQKIVRRSEAGAAHPSRTSYLTRRDLTSVEQEEYAYYEGYLPLWTLWAEQHPDMIDSLEEMLDERTSLSDRFATSDVNAARALSDILNGDGHEFDGNVVGTYFEEAEPVVRWSEGAAPAQVYSLGTGKRQWDEFAQLIPPGTRIVVDMRGKTQNNTYKHFEKSQLPGRLGEMGIGYLHLPGLSGKPTMKENGLYVDGVKKIVDYDALSQLPRFQEAYRTLKEEVQRGGVVILSNERSPMNGSRGLLVGQMLSKDGISVRHVTGIRDYRVESLSQRDVVAEVLARNKQSLVNGDPYAIRFHSDGGWTEDPTIRIVERDNSLPGDSVRERVLPHAPNYGNAVDVKVVQTIEVAPDNPHSAVSRQEAHEKTMNAEMRYAAMQADVTLMMVTSLSEIPMTGVDKPVLPLIVNTRRQSINEWLTNPGTAKKAFSNIVDMRNRTTAAGLYPEDDGRDAVDRLFDAINRPMRLAVIGSNEAKLLNQYVEEAVMEAELSGRDKRRIQNTGLSMSDRTDFSMEALGEFFDNLNVEIERWKGERTAMEQFEGAEIEAERMLRQHTSIEDIITVAETGICDAAALAAQKAGLKVTAVTGPTFHKTIDNETLSGRGVADEALVRNTYNQGLKAKTTEFDIQNGLQRQAALRDEQELSAAPGMTDRQILALQELGFDNTGLVELQELAVREDMVIRNAEDLAAFLELAAGQGIEGSGYATTAALEYAFRRADAYISRAAAQGYGIVTVASQNYPAQMRQFRDYTVEQHSMRVVYDENGASMKDIVEPVRRTYPAVLWYRGATPDLSDGRGVTFIGESSDVAEAMTAAKTLGSLAFKNDLLSFGVLDGSTSEAAVREAASLGGEAVAFSPSPIDDEDTKAATEEIVQSGGTVFSEKGPGKKMNISEGDDQNEARSRASKMSTVLGKGAAIIDAAFTSRPMSIFEGVAWALYGVFAVTYAAVNPSSVMEENKIKAATKGNAKLLQDGAQPITNAGEGFDAVVEAVKGEGQEVVAEQEKAPEMLHPLEASFEVIHFGNSHVFLVDERFPDIRETIYNEYGENAHIANPADKNKILSAFNHFSRNNSNMSVDAFQGYTGTQLYEKQAWIETMYYFRGTTEGMLSVPGRSMNLPDLEDRMAAFKMFSAFSDTVSRMGTDLNHLAGVDTDRQVHYEHAKHPFVSENRVELRRGDDLMLSVWLNRNGEIQWRLNPSLMDSFREYARKERSGIDEIPGKEGVIHVWGNVEEAQRRLDGILDAVHDEIFGNEAWTNIVLGESDRDEKDKSKNATVVDNIMTAMNDVSSSDMLCEVIGDERVEDLAFTMVWGKMVTVEQEVTELTDRLTDVYKEVTQLHDELNNGDLDMTEEEMAQKQALLSEKQELMDVVVEQKRQALTRLAALDLNLHEISSAKAVSFDGERMSDALRDLLSPYYDNMTAARAEMGKITERIVSLQDDLRNPDLESTAKNVKRKELKDLEKAYDKAGKTVEKESAKVSEFVSNHWNEIVSMDVSFNADGRHIAVGAQRPGDCLDEATAKEQREIIREQDQDKPLMKSIQDVRIADDRGVYDTAERPDVKEGVGAGNEEKLDPAIVWPTDRNYGEQNGVSVIEREGKKAYADGSGRIMSAFYVDIEPFGKTSGIVMREDGKRQVVNRQGHEMCPCWFDKLSHVSENAVVVKVDGLYNHWDLDTGKMVSPCWCSEARPFHEGLAVIKAGPADPAEVQEKYNLINRKGELISGLWFDSVSDVHEGVVRIRSDEHTGRMEISGTDGSPVIDWDESPSEGVSQVAQAVEAEPVQEMPEEPQPEIPVEAPTEIPVEAPAGQPGFIEEPVIIFPAQEEESSVEQEKDDASIHM